MIVPTPWLLPKAAFTGLVRLTKNVSSGSATMSPMTGTVMVLFVSPLKNVSVPLAAR